MSFSYSGDPSTSKLDECRFIIGDTDPNDFILQNEEITYMIGQSGTNAVLLHYLLFSQAATIFAHNVMRKLGPQTEDPTARIEFFTAKAAEYKKKLTSSGLSIPTYAAPKTFSKGMQDNPPWRRNIWGHL